MVYLRAFNRGQRQAFIQDAKFDVGLQLDNFRLTRIQREDGREVDAVVPADSSWGFALRFESPAKLNFEEFQGKVKLNLGGRQVSCPFKFGHEPPPPVGSPYRRGPGTMRSQAFRGAPRAG
jgi:hypothetical protein